MIHCIGDSHAAVFGGKEDMQPVWPERSDDQMECFRSYRIGPATAYQLYNKIPIIDEIVDSLVNKEKDIILFCFGEVDIRAHLIKQHVIQNRSLEDLIEECVNRYFEVVLHYLNKGFKVAIWGPIASWNDSKPYTGPSYGTNQQRNAITHLFTKLLVDKGNPFNIPVFSIFEKMLNEDWTTNTYYLDNWNGSHMHLSQTAMPLILEEFKNIC
jgi:hypothetical protein